MFLRVRPLGHALDVDAAPTTLGVDAAPTVRLRRVVVVRRRGCLPTDVVREMVREETEGNLFPAETAGRFPAASARRRSLFLASVTVLVTVGVVATPTPEELGAVTVC